PGAVERRRDHAARGAHGLLRSGRAGPPGGGLPDRRRGAGSVPGLIGLRGALGVPALLLVLVRLSAALFLPAVLGGEHGGRAPAPSPRPRPALRAPLPPRRPRGRARRPRSRRPPPPPPARPRPSARSWPRR